MPLVVGLMNCQALLYSCENLLDTEEDVQIMLSWADTNLHVETTFLPKGENTLWHNPKDLTLAICRRCTNL
jgi:hypothetical protein